MPVPCMTLRQKKESSPKDYDIQKNTYMNILKIWGRTRPAVRRTCPCCNYSGFFKLAGRPPRVDALCPRCKSRERHRLFILGFKRGEIFDSNFGTEIRIIHFAPEPSIEKNLRATFPNYRTSTLSGGGADIALNMHEITLEDKSIDCVIANHVLEHIDDMKACKEVFRILAKGGIFVVSVPLVEGWGKTYENSEKLDTPENRKLHFGEHDHVRYYGRDFRDRVASAGFVLKQEITAEAEDSLKYSLTRGDKIFVFEKNDRR